MRLQKSNVYGNGSFRKSCLETCKGPSGNCRRSRAACGWNLDFAAAAKPLFPVAAALFAPPARRRLVVSAVKAAGDAPWGLRAEDRSAGNRLGLWEIAFEMKADRTFRQVQPVKISVAGKRLWIPRRMDVFLRAGIPLSSRTALSVRVRRSYASRSCAMLPVIEDARCRLWTPDPAIWQCAERSPTRGKERNIHAARFRSLRGGERRHKGPIRTAARIKAVRKAGLKRAFLLPRRDGNAARIVRITEAVSKAVR